MENLRILLYFGDLPESIVEHVDFRLFNLKSGVFGAFFSQKLFFMSWILFGHQLAKVGPKSQNPPAHVIVFIFPYIPTHIGKYLNI
jgi:hypothetical protein